MNKTLTILVCIMVAGVVVGASLPIFDSLTASSESVHNEGAGWVRFALDRNVGTTYNLYINEEDDSFTVMNGTDTQTYTPDSGLDFSTILYADSNVSIWADESNIHILGVVDGSPWYLEGWGDLIVVRDAEGVTIGDGGDNSQSFGVPTWAYIPVSTGNYGFFAYDEERGVKNYPSDMPLAVVGGGNVGVYAYNNIYTYDGLGLVMNPIYDDDGLFYGATWSKPALVEDSKSLPVKEKDPEPEDNEKDKELMVKSVPTPTYTDGDWGYDLIDVDGVTYAKIVSYSGAGGDITIPAIVGSYSVYSVGKGGSSQTVFNTSLTATSLTISAGIKEINYHAFLSCSGLTGTLTLPEGLIKIGDSSFQGTGFTGTLTIPSTVTYLDNSCFSGCSGFTGTLVIPDGVTYLGKNAFRSCTGFTGALVIPDGVTYIGDSCFYGCKFTGAVVIPDGVTYIGTNAFYNITGITSVNIPKSLTTLGSSAFSYMSGLTNCSIIIPVGVTSINNTFYSSTLYYSTIVIPESVTEIKGQPFSGNYCTKFIIASDATPANSNAFSQTVRYGDHADILDLSRTIDYSVNHYGLNSTERTTYYDTIGGCFGFVSVVDVSGNGGGPTQTLIAMLPLVMVLGLVLVAVGIFVWNRM